MSLVSVSISVPSSAEIGQAFLAQGTVFEGPAPLGLMGLGPLAGVTVTIYQGGTSKGTATTNGSGYYSKSVTVNQAGTFPFLAKALGVYSNVDYITITEPAPEPHWEYDSTYRGIEIQVYMPDGTPFKAYYDGSWHTVSSLNILKLGIDAYLDAPEPPEEAVTIYLNPPLNGATLELRDRSYGRDTFVRSQLSVNGVSYFERGTLPEWYIYQVRFPPQTVNGIQYLESRSGQFTFQAAPLEYTLNLQEAVPEPYWTYHSTYRGIEIEVYMPDGTPFKAYYDGKWDVNYELSSIKAGIDAFLEPAVGIPTSLTLSVPDRTGVNENFNVSGLLRETDTGIPIPNQPINHSYNGRPLGSSTTGVDGSYLKVVSVPESGVWTLKSDFPGTEGLQASRSRAGTVVAATPITSALIIAGSIATGIALFAYGTS